MALGTQERVGSCFETGALASSLACAFRQQPRPPELPEILAGPHNAVPQCVTPGRLMAFLKLRNSELNPRYDGIATQYMRFGEEFGIRWDMPSTR